jgi:putative Mn2+ efflux pump MntP
MDFWELLIIAVALAMDAFAVSICKGLATKQSYLKTGLVCGVWFGAFQALMPFLGWLLGSAVAQYVEQIKGYVVFILLGFLGVKMIMEAVKEAKEGSTSCGCSDTKTSETLAPAPHEQGNDSSLAPFVMFTMAIATSIDALATGLTFAATGANIWIAISLIGIVTFACCFVGSIVGAKIGSKCQTQAEIAGGIILIAIGVKFLIEHFLG